MHTQDTPENFCLTTFRRRSFEWNPLSSVSCAISLYPAANLLHESPTLYPLQRFQCLFFSFDPSLKHIRMFWRVDFLCVFFFLLKANLDTHFFFTTHCDLINTRFLQFDRTRRHPTSAIIMSEHKMISVCIVRTLLGHVNCYYGFVGFQPNLSAAGSRAYHVIRSGNRFDTQSGPCSAQLGADTRGNWTWKRVKITKNNKRESNSAHYLKNIVNKRFKHYSLFSCTLIFHSITRSIVLQNT